MLSTKIAILWRIGFLTIYNMSQILALAAKESDIFFN